MRSSWDEVWDVDSTVPETELNNTSHACYHNNSWHARLLSHGSSSLLMFLFVIGSQVARASVETCFQSDYVKSRQDSNQHLEEFETSTSPDETGGNNTFPRFWRKLYVSLNSEEVTKCLQFLSVVTLSVSCFSSFDDFDRLYFGLLYKQKFFFFIKVKCVKTKTSEVVCKCSINKLVSTSSTDWPTLSSPPLIFPISWVFDRKLSLLLVVIATVVRLTHFSKC